MKKTVYICGPMDGLPFRNRQAFFDAERELASEGWRVVSAVKIWAAFGTDLALATDPTLRAAASAACIAAVRECGALYLLPGWDDSGLAFRELNAAIDNSMQILGVGIEAGGPGELTIIDDVCDGDRRATHAFENHKDIRYISTREGLPKGVKVA